MNDALDTALRALKAEPQDCVLDHLEPAVWRRIESMRDAREVSSAFLPVRAAAIIAALGFGVAIGGLGASDARAEQEVSVFSLSTGLAPSTLLDDR